MQMNRIAAALCVAGMLAPVAAFATDGYFQPGYSVKSVGMGGVGIAMAQDALAAAANPAGMVQLGDRFDGGLTVFAPNRSATIGGANYDGNAKSSFLIPELGVNHMIDPTMSLGLSIYGNGGMNSGYMSIAQSGTGLMDGAGVDLQQMFISPSLAWTFAPGQTVGVALNLVEQTFRANGLQNFENPALTANPAGLSDNGHDWSHGIGARLGWIGQLTPNLALGATWQPKTTMTGFGSYNGLFADNGEFDIPANYGVGVRWDATPQWTVAADVERIEYSGVGSIGNSSAGLMAMATGQSTGPKLGQAGGPGFGWSDVTVVKLGVAYAMNEQLTLRAGYNHTDNPVSSANVFFNTVAPGVVQDHMTLGLSYAINKQIEISADYVHAFKNSVSGYAPQFNNLGQVVGQTPETLSMYQDALGIGIGYKF